MKLKRWLKGVVIMAIGLGQLACSVMGVRKEETPKYEVIEREGEREIRVYAPHIVAKTVVPGDYDKASRDAFRVLAGYIFGANEKKQSISMTAPVVMEKTDQGSGEKIAMTAPVTQTLSKDGWVMTFMMPSQYRLEDLPKPKDQRVALETVPERTFAVIRFRGSRAEHVNRQKAEELSSWLKKLGTYEIISDPAFAGYDPPWTIPAFRRNEVLVEVRKSVSP